MPETCNRREGEASLYSKSCGVNYLHLMPLLDSPKGRNDGGYAVSDFTQVQPELGTMEDLEDAGSRVPQAGGSACCLDFVMNHTSEDHEWAEAARAGDPEYRGAATFSTTTGTSRIEFEKTMPAGVPDHSSRELHMAGGLQAGCHDDVLPLPVGFKLRKSRGLQRYDRTIMLYLANRGIDVMRLDAVPYIWKELGTSCRNLPQVHTIVRMMRHGL